MPPTNRTTDFADALPTDRHPFSVDHVLGLDHQG